MANTYTSSKTSRPLSGLLAETRRWSLADRLTLIRSIALQVRALHEQGRTHRAISPDSVGVDAARQPQLDPPAPPSRFGGEGADPELCPPELIAADGLDLSDRIEAAAAALHKDGHALDPRRIDVYQLGTLLCRLLTGESILGYMYDPAVKAKVPDAARSLLQGALGDGAAPIIEDCDGLITALDATLAEVPESQPPTSARDTPPGGSVIGSESDTPPHGHRQGVARQKSEELPFQCLGPYRVTGRIGSGGMGDVYRGHDQALGRDVAIKVLPPEMARDEDFVRRFQAEASAAANLSHPNVVPVYFIGEDDGYHFFAMRLIDGEPLSARLDRAGRFPLEDAVDLLEKCLAGLQAAHAQDLIHRDIKPGNILLERETGRPVLVDFGLVRRTGQQTRMTVTGMVMGTVDYMAPEQARGKNIDCRADIYALGVLLYQTLAGRLPFDAETPTAMMFQHAYEEPFPLQEAAPDAPDAVTSIVARMMAKDPDERYATCEDVLADVAAFREGRPLAEVPVVDRSRTGDSSGPRSRDSGYEEGAATSELPEAGDIELPSNLDELADHSPLRRVRDFAATMFRRHAPDFVQNLQSTTQQVDGAVDHYDRRRGRLAKLLDEARGIEAELSQQKSANEAAAAAAAAEAESLADGEQTEAALVRRRECDEQTAALQTQLDQQREQVEEFESQLAKADATLARLRSQRDVLQARMGAAGLVRGQDATPRRRRPQVIAVVALSLIVVVAGLLLLSIPLFRSTTDGPPAAKLPVSAPGALTFDYQIEDYSWRSGQPLVPMMPVNEGFCVLTQFGGEFEGPGQRAVVTAWQDGLWYVGGFANRRSPAIKATSFTDFTPQIFRPEVSEYRWMHPEPPVKMLHKSEGVCFLSGLHGTLEGGGEGVKVALGDDGYWYLSGKSVKPYLRAQAIGLHFVDAKGLQAEITRYSWKRGEPPVKMIHRSEGFCGLALIGGGFEGPAEHVRLFVGEDGYWYLSARSRQKAMYADAIAVRVSKTGEADRTDASPPASAPRVPPPLPPGGGIAADQWVDLLKWIDIDRDRVRGGWTRQRDELLANGAKGCAEIMPPVSFGHNYDLEIDFTLTAGEGIVVVLPAKEKTLNVFVSPTGKGIQWVAGQYWHPAAANSGNLIPGQRQTLLYSVRLQEDQAQVDVTLDDEPLLSWSGSASSLSGWPLTVPPRPQIGVWKGAATFHGMRVRDPAGETTWIERSPID